MDNLLKDRERDEGRKRQPTNGDLEAGEAKETTKSISMWVGAYGGVEDQSTWVRLTPSSKWMQWAEVAFNPIVSLASLILILGFVVWAMVCPEIAHDEFSIWKSWVGLNFTWLYVGAQNGWILFVVYLYFSKYSNIRLGPEDSRPEYSDVSWFCMLFACGLSTGLFFYGVAEPIYHYTGRNRYTADPSFPDNKMAQQAIAISLYHYGLHGWVVYTVLGLMLSLMAHREGLPLTIKSCFYPLIGEKIFGWPGDLVDVLSVLATVCGICTALGVGTIQINHALHLMNPSFTESTRTQVVIIWTIIVVATVSVLSGVKYGIRRISEFCFCCGLLIMMLVLLMDKTVFLLNLSVQSVGYYASSIVQLGYHTDAFEQLGPSTGAEDRGRVLPPGVETTDGPAGWMNDWTLFYWGWWIAWSPFVGSFIAKISHGRTLKEFILGTMAAPTIYVSLWFILFGGSGLRMEREAAEAGLCCHNLDINEVQLLSIESPSSQVSLNDSLCGSKDCSDCTKSLVVSIGNISYSAWSREMSMMHEPEWWGITTQDRKLTRLSCRKTEEMWFDLMMSYGDLGPFLSGFSLISLILYFVTSADSGCLVIDCLASNGHNDPPPLQRLLWALTEGLATTSLLVAGGKQALVALQAMAIATGLIYNVLICIVCVALWHGLQIQAGDRDFRGASFPIHLLDPFFSDPFPKVLSHFRNSLRLFLGFVRNIFIAPFTLAKVARTLHGKSAFWPVLLGLSLFLSLFVILNLSHVLKFGVDGGWALGCVAYVTFVFGITILRGQMRKKLGIRGSSLEDFLVSFVLYPSVALQLDMATQSLHIQK